MNNITQLLKSKKFIILVCGILFVVIADVFNVSVESIITAAGMFSTYILGQGIADSGKEKAKMDRILKGEFSSDVKAGKI